MEALDALHRAKDTRRQGGVLKERSTGECEPSGGAGDCNSGIAGSTGEGCQTEPEIRLRSARREIIRRYPANVPAWLTHRLTPKQPGFLHTLKREFQESLKAARNDAPAPAHGRGYGWLNRSAEHSARARGSLIKFLSPQNSSHGGQTTSCKMQKDHKRGYTIILCVPMSVPRTK